MGTEMLDEIRAIDPWAADVLSEALVHHPDILDALGTYIHNLLHADEALAHEIPPITREDLERVSMPGSLPRRPISDEVVALINQLRDEQRPRRLRALARSSLRDAIRRQFYLRRLPLPPQPVRATAEPDSGEGNEATGPRSCARPAPPAHTVSDPSVKHEHDQELIPVRVELRAEVVGDLRAEAHSLNMNADELLTARFQRAWAVMKERLGSDEAVVEWALERMKERNDES